MKQSVVLRRVLARLRPYRAQLLLLLLCSALVVGANLSLPVLFGRAIDLLSGKDALNWGQMSGILAACAFIALFGALLQWLLSVLVNRIGYGTVRQLRQDSVDKLQRLPLSYLDTHPSGELLSRIIADAEQFSDGLLLSFSQLLMGVLTILSILVFMFLTRPGIALAVLLLTPISILTAQFIAKRTYAMFRVQSELRGRKTSFVEEMLGGLKTVKAFSREAECRKDFEQINDAYAKASLRAVFFSSLPNPTTRFLNSLVYASVALIGSLSAISGGTMTVGVLTCLLSYSAQYAKPFNEISGILAEMQNALACAARIFDLLDETEEVQDSPAAVIPQAVAGDVAMCDVSFSYTADRPLIEHLSLQAKPGELVAIVGPTGCGKTTLINLLMRFYDPQDGAILLDGQNIRSLSRKGLRRQYGMVLQDSWFCEGTVAENIAFGHPDATRTEIVEAARHAHADSFIRRLPNGYDTVLSEDGGGLSLGQKQLLCIARVMLRLPPMLILDEATSSIDTRTELRVQRVFTEMMRGRTCFVVAHRLSTIRRADLILAMRDGKIVEQGTHAQLLVQNGFYASLYNSQFAPSDADAK